MVANNGQRARILHLSDLHFGTRFDGVAWQNVRDKALERKPNLVIVTGDLVNSPWRWRMNWAKKELSKLKERLGCDVIVVPGNHDTRVVGLLPVKWIPWMVLGFASLFLATFFFLVPIHPMLGTLLCAALAFPGSSLLLLRFCLASFDKHFSAFRLTSVYKYENLGIELHAFDSATAALYGARGRIPVRQFVDARNFQTVRAAETNGSSDGEADSRRGLYRIAILHHHPLPIPYDDAGEPLMVADNAGAFLSEISKMKVRLILHGHKHRRHFSRVTINANETNEYEVAVLSTGTATHGPGTQSRGHNFNLLELDDYGNMKVTPYVATGGTFENGKPFFVEQGALADQRLYESEVEGCGIKCKGNVIRIEINGEGDIIQRHEFHGFHVEQDRSALKELPRPITARVTTGHIEGFRGQALDSDSPENVTFIPDRGNLLTRQSGRISFGRNLLPKDDPLSLFFGYTGLNALAMTRQQHAQMYEAQQQRDEYIQVSLTQCPSEELSIIIKFPVNFKIGGRPNLLVERKGSRFADLENKYGRSLEYYPSLNLIIFRIRYPPLHLKYKIEWHLTDAAPPGGERTNSLEGGAEKIADGLLRTIPATWSDPGIQQLLQVIEDQTRKHFELGDKTEEHIDVSLMAYDTKVRALRIVAANFPMTAVMQQFQLKYGDGIAGRAYKMNAGRVFVKRLAMKSDSPSYYYPKDGKPYKLDDVDDQVIISIPLRHPEDKTLIYGILNISSRTAWSKLQDIKEASALDESSAYHLAMGLICFQVLKERILHDGS